MLVQISQDPLHDPMDAKSHKATLRGDVPLMCLPSFYEMRGNEHLAMWGAWAPGNCKAALWRNCDYEAALGEVLNLGPAQLQP